MVREQRLERKQRRLEINANAGRPKEVLLNELNTRSKQNRSILVSPPSGPPRSSSVPLERLDRVDRLKDDEESNVEPLNLVRNMTFKKKHVSSELYTDQGEGITQKLKRMITQ